MSNLSDELRIIRRGGWMATILVYLLILAAALALVQVEPEIRGWPQIGRIGIVLGMTILPALYVLLVAYVYADARRREMRYILWSLLAFFVPYAIGIIVYFIMRDPLPAPCPTCGAMTPHAFTFCPQCGTVVKPSCPQCHRALQRGWTHCPTCGAAQQKQENGK
jgi:RNA polymerase subunit RPABC4/transcription elongation factor Spt4